VRLPRAIDLEPDARLALGQILGIMSDQIMSGNATRWEVERLMELEVRLGVVSGTVSGTVSNTTDAEAAGPASAVTLGIDDAALLLDGMAFTEMASVDLPWIEMVRWTSDFISGELRSHWTEAEWLELAADPR
jgi:hypothetical protein